MKRRLDSLLDTATQSWRRSSATTPLALSTTIPRFLTSSIAISPDSEGLCVGEEGAVEANITCLSCAIDAICTQCAEVCHSDHACASRSRFCQRERAVRHKGCMCGASCMLARPGSVAISHRAGGAAAIGADVYLAAFVQCLFVNGIFSKQSLLTEASDSEGFVPLYRLLHALQNVDPDGLAEIGPLPNLSNAAGSLALSPFFRFSKFGSSSRVKVSPCHPRADLVVVLAARHLPQVVRGLSREEIAPSLQSRCVSVSVYEAASILQRRIIGSRALDRVIEPAALIWVALARSAAINTALKGPGPESVLQIVVNERRIVQFATECHGHGHCASAPNTMRQLGRGQSPSASDATMLIRVECLDSDEPKDLYDGPGDVQLTTITNSPEQTVAVAQAASGSPEPATGSDTRSSQAATATLLGCGACDRSCCHRRAGASTAEATADMVVVRMIQLEVEAAAARAAAAVSASVVPVSDAAHARRMAAPSRLYDESESTRGTRGFFDGFSASKQRSTLPDPVTLVPQAGDSIPFLGRHSELSEPSVAAEQKDHLQQAATAASQDDELDRPMGALASVSKSVPPARPAVPGGLEALGTVLSTLADLQEWASKHLPPVSSAPQALALRVYAQDASSASAEKAAGTFYSIPLKVVDSIAIAAVPAVAVSNEHDEPVGCRPAAAATVVIDVAAIRCSLQTEAGTAAHHQPALRSFAVTSSRKPAALTYRETDDAAGAALRDALSPALLDPGILKVMHAGTEACAWLQRCFGLSIVHALDTHICLDEMSARAASEKSTTQPAGSTSSAMHQQTVRQNLLPLPLAAAADLRKLEYSETLAAASVANPAPLLASLELVRSLPITLQQGSVPRMTRSSSSQANAVPSHADKLEEVSGLLCLAGRIAKVLEVPEFNSLKHFASSAGRVWSWDVCPASYDIAPPLAACFADLRRLSTQPSGRDGAAASVLCKDNIIWHCAALRSELLCLRTPPFDAFHLGSQSAPAATPPWYSICARCRRHGHGIERCPER